MTFEGITFNEDFWKTKTEAQFIAHEGHHGLSIEQLQEAFSLIVPKSVEKYQPVDTGVAVDTAE